MPPPSRWVPPRDRRGCGRVGGCGTPGNDSTFPAARQPRRRRAIGLSRAASLRRTGRRRRQSSCVTAPPRHGGRPPGPRTSASVADTRIEGRAVILRTEREADSPAAWRRSTSSSCSWSSCTPGRSGATRRAHLRQWLDVHYFVWEMGWVARRILEAPRALFDANIFYPHGLSLAFSEPMLVPRRHRLRPGLRGQPESDPRVQRDRRAVPGAGGLGRILRRPPADGERRGGMDRRHRLRALAHPIRLLPLRAHAAVVRDAASRSWFARFLERRAAATWPGRSSSCGARW